MSNNLDTQTTETYTDVPETGTVSEHTAPEVRELPRIDKINRDIEMNIRLAVEGRDPNAERRALEMIGERQALLAASLKPFWRSAPKERRRTF